MKALTPWPPLPKTGEGELLASILFSLAYVHQLDREKRPDFARVLDASARWLTNHEEAFHIYGKFDAGDLIYIWIPHSSSDDDGNLIPATPDRHEDQVRPLVPSTNLRCLPAMMALLIETGAV